MDNLSEKTQRLHRQIVEAQNNNQNQLYYEWELNKYGYTYNPFNKKINKMNIITYFSKNDKGFSVEDIKKEDFTNKGVIIFLVSGKKNTLLLSKTKGWVGSDYNIADENGTLYKGKTIKEIKDIIKKYMIDKGFKEAFDNIEQPNNLNLDLERKEETIIKKCKRCLKEKRHYATKKNNICLNCDLLIKREIKKLKEHKSRANFLYQDIKLNLIESKTVKEIESRKKDIIKRYLGKSIVVNYYKSNNDSTWYVDQNIWNGRKGVIVGYNNINNIAYIEFEGDVSYNDEEVSNYENSKNIKLKIFKSVSGVYIKELDFFFEKLNSKNLDRGEGFFDENYKAFTDCPLCKKRMVTGSKVCEKCENYIKQADL